MTPPKCSTTHEPGLCESCDYYYDQAERQRDEAKDQGDDA